MKKKNEQANSKKKYKCEIVYQTEMCSQNCQKVRFCLFVEYIRKKKQAIERKTNNKSQQVVLTMIS
jgi:hypothetical protein